MFKSLIPAMKKTEAILLLFAKSTHYVLFPGTKIIRVDYILFTGKFTLYDNIITFLWIDVFKSLPTPPSMT